MNPAAEWLRCASSAAYFIEQYVKIYDATARAWIPFGLWHEQYTTLKAIELNLWVVILKARQLGLTWLCLAYALWLMLFHGPVTILVFSRRDDEAMYLLSDERLGGMYSRLPDYLRARSLVVSNDHELALSNGSVVRAFPPTAGDSYTASLVIVDEADLIPDFGRLMRSVKPTIDGGGRMVILSRSNKSDPLSEFKNLYREAVAGRNGWAAVFLPWWVRPARNAAWYDVQRADILARTGAIDDLHEQYPATDTEALAPRSLDKRIPPAWLERVFGDSPIVAMGDGIPSIPGLVIYRLPEPGRAYCAGADPAEGNPGSDPSACEMLDAITGDEVAAFSGKIDPSVFGGYVADLCRFYNRAAVLPERNNHGHALILWLRDNARDVRVLPGEDGKPGWLDHSRGKVLLYSRAADVVRPAPDGVPVALLHSRETLTQLQSIEGASLRAPEGMHDDRADAWALANLARGLGLPDFDAVIIPGSDPLLEIDRSRF